MTPPIDLHQLQTLCGAPLPAVGGGAHAWNRLRELGPLGRLWLKREVLERGENWQRELNGETVAPAAWAGTTVSRGECGILLATENAEAFPLLRPAFILPVEWRHGGHSSPLLPAGMGEFASGVLQNLQIDDLSLHLPDWLASAGADLSGLEFSYDSAWAALAAGAFVASNRGTTLPDVLVSAAWNQLDAGLGWIAGIDRVSEKLDEAVASGARIVLLPRENSRDAEAWASQRPGPTIDIRYLSNATDTPVRAIAPLLHSLEAAPTQRAGASFQDCSGYYTRMPEKGHNEYYSDELLTDVVDRLRPQIAAEPRLQGITKLVLIASKSWSLGFLLVSLFDPDHVLLLHDGRLAKETDTLMAGLPKVGREAKRARNVCSAECRPGDSFVDDVAGAIAAFTSGREAVRLLADITAGYRDFQFAVVFALPRGAEVMFVHAPQHRQYVRVLPGTERIRLLPFGDR